MIFNDTLIGECTGRDLRNLMFDRTHCELWVFVVVETILFTLTRDWISPVFIQYFFCIKQTWVARHARNELAPPSGIRNQTPGGYSHASYHLYQPLIIMNGYIHNFFSDEFQCNLQREGFYFTTKHLHA